MRGEAGSAVTSARGPLLASALASLVSLAALGLGGTTAAASSMILLEVHDGPRADWTDATLRAVRHALRTRDVVVEPRALAELRNELLPGAGRWDEELTLPELIAQLEAGVRSYLRGSFLAAEQQLEAALAVAHRNPALVVSDATSRQWMTQALASLALARVRLGKRTAALEALAEQIRSYPEQPVTRAAFGSRGELLYGDARRALEAGPRGGLLIDVSDPNARIYINEYGRGRGGTFASDVFPGSYRVLVMVGGQARLYRVAVHGNEQTRLLIDWSADGAFISCRAWVGLRLPARDRALRAARTRAIARRLAFHDAIFVGVDAGAEGPTLWGVVHEKATGRRLRSAALPLTGRAAAELQSFAAFLAAGDLPTPLPSAGERAPGPPRAPRNQRDAPYNPASERQPTAARISPRRQLPARASASSRTGRGVRWASWGLGVLGVAAIGAGVTTAATSWSVDCRDGASCGRDPAAMAWAIALATSGLVSCGVAALLHADARRARASGVGSNAASGAAPLTHSLLPLSGSLGAALSPLAELPAVQSPPTAQTSPRNVPSTASSTSPTDRSRHGTTEPLGPLGPSWPELSPPWLRWPSFSSPPPSPRSPADPRPPAPTAPFGDAPLGGFIGRGAVATVSWHF